MKMTNIDRVDAGGSGPAAQMRSAQVTTAAPTPGSPASAKVLNRHAGMLFEQFEQQIQRADLKAQLILAVDAIFAAGLSPLAKGIFASLATPSSSLVDKVEAVLTFAALAALIISLFYALAVIRPNLTAPTKSNLFFFVYAASKTEKEYVEDFQAQTPTALQEALLAEVRSKADIAREKYDYIRLSVFFLTVVVILWGGIEVVQTVMSK